MSSLRKVLLAMLLVSLTGSAFGAGTFASFTATTTNAGSTFASGTLVLSNTNPSQTACLSTGQINGVGPTNTDTNAFSCSAAFSATLRAPGQSATGNITIENRGNLAASALYLYRAGACADSDTGDSTFHGTGSMCGAAQFTVQETATSGGANVACWYGGGASGFVAGTTAITFPTTVFDATNDQFVLERDNNATDVTITLAGYPYANRAALQSALQTAISATALNGLVDAAVGLDNKVYFASRTIRGASQIELKDAGADNAADNLGMAAIPATGTGAATGCTATPIHTLTHFATTYTASGASTAVNLGAMTEQGGADDDDFYTLGVSLPTDAGNEYQGRQASIGFSWTIVQ